MTGRWLAWLLVGALAGCSPDLPEPDDPGALVLQARCNNCHRVYAPQTMTFEMWKVQITRMQRLFAQRGIPWLSPQEERVLLAYLERHAGTQ